MTLRRLAASTLMVGAIICFAQSAHSRIFPFPADIIFFGGPIVTVDPWQPEVEALAVRQGRIIGVGSQNKVFHLRGLTTKMIDLGGHTLMPGFVEAHAHVTNSALFNFLALDVSSFDVAKPNSVQQVQDALSTRVSQVPVDCGTEPRTTPCSWLLAFGYDPSRAVDAAQEYTFPPLRAEDLDAVSTTVPIFVFNQSGHIAYVNHLAFTLADVTDANCDEVVPGGGRYICENGRLTGQLSEPPAFTRFLTLAQRPDPLTLFRSAKKVLRRWAKAGITTGSDLSTGAVAPCDSEGENCGEMVLLRLLADNSLAPAPVRLRSYLIATQFCDPQNPSQCDASKIPVAPLDGDERLRFVGIKFFGDGSTQGFSAFLKAPYLPNFCTPSTGCISPVGFPVYASCAQLAEAMRPFFDMGWPLAVHSNGDASTDQVLCAYNLLLGGESDHGRHRLRIEHFTVTTEEQVTQVKQLGLTPSLTIGHVYFWGSAFFHDILGPERASDIDPTGWLKAHRVRFSLNSDAPITPAAPLRAIQTAVTRLWQLPPREVLGPQQRLTVDEAIKAVTLDAAWQLFADKEVGSLKVGKLADLVELEQNPRSVDPHTIMNIKVVRTFLAGILQTNPELDNCTRGATPSLLAANIADPTLPFLRLCVFNAIYTDSFAAAYADNPKLSAKGAAPYEFYSYGKLAQAYTELFVDQSLYAAPFKGDDFSNTRELAAFFANINQETNGASPPSFLANGNFTPSGAGSLGAAYGLTAITEGSCALQGCPQYGTKKGFCENTDGTAKLSACDGKITTPDGTDYCSLAVKFCADKAYPPNIPANQFFGRGSKQLTHAYNYIFYGSRMNTKEPLALANQPSLIDTNGVLGWKVGLAYWSIPFQEPSGAVKPSMHDGFFKPTTGSVSAEFNAQTGFGKTVNIINGGIECGASHPFIRNTTLSRINSYIELLLRLDSSIPINRVEVTKKDGSVDVFYSLADLQRNIETQNPLNPGYNPLAPDASQLVKYYSSNGVARQSNYSPFEPGWTMQWGGNGRYNSAPLLQEYYFAADTPGGAGNVYNNGQTNLKKIMLFYDTNTAGITEERLDCAGVQDYSGN